VFPVRYELNSYILFRINFVFKGFRLKASCLIHHLTSYAVGKLVLVNNIFGLIFISNLEAVSKQLQATQSCNLAHMELGTL
jgi:hypothetical protein